MHTSRLPLCGVCVRTLLCSNADAVSNNLPMEAPTAADARPTPIELTSPQVDSRRVTTYAKFRKLFSTRHLSSEVPQSSSDPAPHAWLQWQRTPRMGSLGWTGDSAWVTPPNLTPAREPHAGARPQLGERARTSHARLKPHPHSHTPAQTQSHSPDRTLREDSTVSVTLALHIPYTFIRLY